jgi:hypothetical protein
MKRLGYLLLSSVIFISNAHGKDLPYIEGEIIVRFKKGVREEKIKEVHSLLSGEIIKNFRIVDGLQLIKIREDVERAIRKYKSNPFIEYAEPNYKYYALNSPNDPYFTEQWGLENTNNFDIDATLAWDITTGGDVVIAVIDTGVDYAHPDLLQNIWINPYEIPGNNYDDDENGIADDYYGANVLCFDPYLTAYCKNPSDPMDDHSHGTHVAGIIGAVGNNGIGVTGVNWKVKIMPVKFLTGDGWGTLAGAIMAMEYVLNMKRKGVNIIATSNSWGAGSFSYALMDAIKELMKEGILCIAAAGNSSADNAIYPLYPASYNLLNVIAVSAIDRYGKLAWFSNYGKTTVHVGAPGVDILSTVLGGEYEKFSGTSMATPFVSGIAGLISSSNPSLKWYEIRNLILAGGEKIQSLENRTITGRLVNAKNSISCTDRRVFYVNNPKDGRSYSSPSIKLEAVNINCSSPAGEVKVSTPEGEISLQDDGTPPDEIAGDGVYSGIYYPSSSGTKALVFSNSITSTEIKINVTSGEGYYSFDPFVPFEWFDASAGNFIFLWDDQYALISLPFPVYLYGRQYTSLYVSDNGYLTPDPPSYSIYYNTHIPTSFMETGIFPYWDDLIPLSYLSGIYTKTFGDPPSRKFVIEWKNFYHFIACLFYGKCERITFEVIFYENEPEKITFSYLDTTFGDPSYDNGSSASIGIQLSSSYGQEFSYEAPVLRDRTSITLSFALPSFERPVLSVEPEEVWFDTVFTTPPLQKPVRIINTGNLPLIINQMAGPFSPHFLLNVPSLPLELSPGEEILLSITYLPQNAGMHRDAIIISSNGGTKVISLTGYSFSSPDIKIFSSSLDFGNIPVGEYVDLPFKVSNTGMSSLLITSILLPESFYLSYPPPFPVEVKPGESILFTVRFAPQEGKVYFGNMTILSNDPDEGMINIFLFGEGILRSIIELDRVILNFGEVEIGRSKRMEFLISNGGNSALEGQLELPAGFSSPVASFLLYPMENLSVAVDFSPQEEKEYSDFLIINSNDPLYPQKAILLIGKGVKKYPKIFLEPSVLNFGEVEIGKTVVQKLTIKNTGDAPLLIENAKFPDECSMPQSANFPLSITSGGSLSVDIYFTPKEEKIYSGTILITSNDKDNPEVSVIITGAGVAGGEGGCGCSSSSSFPDGFMIILFSLFILKKLKLSSSPEKLTKTSSFTFSSFHILKK